MKLSTGITKTAAGNMKSRGGAPLAWMKTSREQNQRKTTETGDEQGSLKRRTQIPNKPK
jgi:hypothetical protein